jgi:hypothetical protein
MRRPPTVRIERAEVGMIRKPLEPPPDIRAEVILGEKEHAQLGVMTSK